MEAVTGAEKEVGTSPPYAGIAPAKSACGGHFFELDKAGMQHILVVDQSPITRNNLYRMLANHAYRVESAAYPAQAESLALAATPDVILMDVFLPQLDGLFALRRFRRNSRLAKIPIVMTASPGFPSLKIQALWHGAADYLVKPIDERELLCTLRTVDKLPIREPAMAG